ncbi:MAG: SDR family NAD(P)-dependent oxidoreductase [Pirellula sp.]|jgi:acyl transferase domain-containing protein/NADP-dependent 3-hydroxy acid dehydrogenase YdfG/acyl carrier protein|nr:SDR family NAD(P)-dependent oxidoreductase [Pirellula sp.]
MFSSNQNKQALAIVGMACRFPGELTDIDKLWRGLCSKYSAIREVPVERWDADRYYSTNEESRGKAYVRRGGFLKRDPREFDASFFGISPRDAENMDPQQRLMLEVTWEAFENAGLKIPEYSKKNVGVYVGGFMLDHMITQMAVANRSQINQYSASGMMMTMLSNRVSHAYDFRGPSLSIDTACSSSLVAFHFACQDVWEKRCDLAVVGGVNCMMRPEYPMGMCKGHFLARDGECKSFDERGDGYGRAEGAGVVLIKPLEKAIADGDDIWATVLATGTNQDGHTPGISMPNGESQRELILSVCEQYEIDPSSIQYVECHGTGTAIGDPTEARAIGETYGRGRNAENRVIIGSIKSNIGHMEAGAGVAGIIKATLTLHHGLTTPLANLQTPNPSIPFDELGIKLSDDLYKLDQSKGPARAAVNSFGYGGSNAHAILEQYQPSEIRLDSQTEASPNVSTLGPKLLPISAKSADATKELAQSYLDLLENGCTIDDLIFSVIQRRAHLGQRAIVSGTDTESFKNHLHAYAKSEACDAVMTGQAPYAGSDKIVFVFTGMGPQWWGMGQELYLHDSIYRAAVDEADAVFKSVSGFSALTEMLKGETESQITKTEFAQPANFLIQIGLAATLKARGVEPAACVGHSVGELASAYISGALSLHDAMVVCFHRSQQQAKARGAGSMIAIGANLQKANEIVSRFGGTISIAAVNGVNNITLAGETASIEQVAIELTEAGLFNKVLEVEVPYHGPAMDPLMEPLRQALSSVSPSKPNIPLYSTVTGKRVDEVDFGADYWPKNIRQPVEFVEAMHSILDDGYCIFVEIGPHPVLATSIKECTTQSGKDCRQLYTLRRKNPELASITRAVMECYALGGSLDWDRIVPRAKIVKLPNYPWQREFLWLENDRAAQDRMNPIVYPILGTQEAPATFAFRNDFDHEIMNYLRDHKVMGLAILPAAGYVESFMELASNVYPETTGITLRNFEIFSPLIMKDDRGIDFVTTYEPISGMATSRSLDNGKMGTGTTHASAIIGKLNAKASVSVDLKKLLELISVPVNTKDFYKQLASIGLQYGPAFQTVKELFVSSDRKQTLAKLSHDMPEWLAKKHRMHPSVLDGCFQTLMAMIDTQSATYLPTSIDEVRLFVDCMPEEVWCHGNILELNSRFVDCDLDLYNRDGVLIASVKRLRANAAAKKQRTDKWGDPVKLQILKYNWTPGDNLSEPKRLGNWFVVGDQSELSRLVCQQLENFGAIVAAHILPGDSLEFDGREVTLDPESNEHWHEVFSRCDELDGIVFTNSLDAWPQSDDPTGQWQLRRIVSCLQSYILAKRLDNPRIYIATQAAFQISDDDQDVNPAQASFNGFARVAYNEMEVGKVSTIDLPATIDPSSFESFIQELMCDAAEDEIAIRDGQRFVSELTLTDDLTKDVSRLGSVDKHQAVLVRPSLSDNDVGTIRVLADDLEELQPCDVRIVLEKAAVPVSFIKESPEDIITRPWMEFVGGVAACGREQSIYTVGQRICGLVRAETASHLTVPASELHAVPIADDIDASLILASLVEVTKMTLAMESVHTEPGQWVAVEATSLGMRFANALKTLGCNVVLISDDASLGESSGYTVCSKDVVELDRIVVSCTGGNGFSVVIADAARWGTQFGWRHFAKGGYVVDLEESTTSFAVAQHIASVVRTSLDAITNQPRRLKNALSYAIGTIQKTGDSGSNFFEVSLHDLAWQRFSFNDGLGTLILSFEKRDAELPVIASDKLTIAPGGTYLITGGLGGFGQQTARWLAEHGCESLVLTGRTGANTPEKKKFVEDLEAKGTKVLAIACDSSDRSAVRALLATIQQELPPLKGIIHSAAEIIDQPVAEIDLTSLSKVMQNKAQAAWVLHEESREIPLDHFILYSSAANLVGNSRQSIYSAANGFLNGLAFLRRRMNLPGTSINWGAIGDVGIVARDEKLENFLRYVGLSGMDSWEALDYLRLAMVRDITQIGVLIMKSWADWGRFEVRAGNSPRYQALIAGDEVGNDSEAKNKLIEELSQLQEEEQLEVLIALITDVLSGVLKADSSSIHRARPLNELGVDSLMATEIQMTLEQTLGLKVAVLELLGDSTVMSLARSSLVSLNIGKAVVVSN